MSVEQASILILTFNSERYVAATVSAALTQSYPHCEVLVADNGSSDATLERLRAFPSARVVANGVNTGYARGMNQLFDLSTGSVVIFLNADCVLASDFVETAVSYLGVHPDVCALGATVTAGLPTQEGGGLDGAVLGVTDTMRVRLSPVLSGEPALTFKPNGACPVYRRAALESCATPRAEPFAEVFDTYGEDIDLAFRLAAAGCRTVHVPLLRAAHDRSHQGSGRISAKRGRLRQNLLAARHLNAARHLPWARRLVVTPLLFAQDLGYLLVRLLRGDLQASADVGKAWMRSWRSGRDVRAWRSDVGTHRRYDRAVTLPARTGGLWTARR